MVEAIKQLAGKVDNLTNHTRTLETQIAQVASSSSRAQGRFLGQPETTPIEHCNTTFLRSGKILEKPAENVDERIEVTHMSSIRERMRKNPNVKIKNLIPRHK